MGITSVRRVTREMAPYSIILVFVMLYLTMTRRPPKRSTILLLFPITSKLITLLAIAFWILSKFADEILTQSGVPFFQLPLTRYQVILEVFGPSAGQI